MHFACLDFAIGYYSNCTLRDTGVRQDGMAAAALKELCELDELKKDTAVTRNVLFSAEKLLALGDKDENITRLMTAVKRAYHHMLQAVSKYKLSTTKKDRLWKMFHSFSVKEGHRMCKECDDSLGLKAHDTFWQLLLEREFIARVSDYLGPLSLIPVIHLQQVVNDS